MRYLRLQNADARGRAPAPLYRRPAPVRARVSGAAPGEAGTPDRPRLGFALGEDPRSRTRLPGPVRLPLRAVRDRRRRANRARAAHSLLRRRVTFVNALVAKNPLPFARVCETPRRIRLST